MSKELSDCQLWLVESHRFRERLGKDWRSPTPRARSSGRSKCCKKKEVLTVLGAAGGGGGVGGGAGKKADAG